ncbi:MAG: H4MPT-linked C1 transfer pathway protein [Planctomycetota bacterium]|nr:H4MPT-linked C1 transfer pathway protein [Planctomycetota bacterium]MDA1247630.1 H4MPT-linked C1 transfer pathway protein [Planctomycetota bacterium]
MNHVVGLDIGGANLKAAHSDGSCRSRPFAIWQSPDKLGNELQELIGDWLPCRALAVTMTAELADCFATKAEGVDRILASVESLAGDIPVSVWQTGGEFVSPEFAREFPLLTAAANWHALATFVGRMAPRGRSLLIDIGTTTCDIIPIENGLPMPTGRTDLERLQSGELVYSGVRRTPVCAVAHSVPLGEGYVQLAAELFATMLDVYLLTGDIAENASDCETANGRAATVEFAHDRLARAICGDRAEVSLDEARGIASFLADVQQQRLAGGLNRVLAGNDRPVESVLVSGSGSFLARRLVESHPKLSGATVHQLTEIFSPEVGEAACAFALAKLGDEQIYEAFTGRVSID